MKRLALYATLALLTVTGGCVCTTGSSRGDLTVLYTFDGALCGVAGARDVRVTVEGLDTADGDDLLVSCAAFPEGITLEDLREGSYRVDLQGLGRSGEVLYALYDVRVEVRGGADNVYDLDAIPRLGDLAVYWTFDGSAGCGGVVDVRVTVVDPTGFTYDDSLYRCSAAGVIYDDVLAGGWLASLDGLDAGGRVLYTARNVGLEVDPGVLNEWTVDLR